MSYTAHHRSHHDAYSPEARGSGVRASRDPQAATSGQATTTTHTPDHHRGAYPPEPGQTRISPPRIRPALALRTLLACPTSSPSPVDLATGAGPTMRSLGIVHTRRRQRLHQAVAPGLGRLGQPLWLGAAGHTPSTALATAFRDRHGPLHKGHGGVSAPPPDPRSHHDGLQAQRFITRSRSR